MSNNLDLINYGLRIALGAPTQRFKRQVRHPVRAPAHALREPPATEIAVALRRVCERRGLMPPVVRS
jgi:hypothetical protein